MQINGVMRTNFNFHEWMISLLAIKEMYKKLHKSKLTQDLVINVPKKDFLHFLTHLRQELALVLKRG